MQHNNDDQFRLLSAKNNNVLRKTSVSLNKGKRTDKLSYEKKFLQELLTRNNALLRTEMMHLKAKGHEKNH